MQPISLHICDDHPLVASSIIGVLQNQPQFKHLSSSISKASLFSALQREEKPDVLILDVNVNGFNMLDEIPAIKVICPEIKIIILTSYESQSLLRDAILHGVHGFLNKNTEMSELLAVIETIGSGQVYISSSAYQGFKYKDRFELLLTLSSREKEIVGLLIAGHPNKSIAELLQISVTTVQTHRRNIYKKLELNGIRELMVLAMDINLTSM